MDLNSAVSKLFKNYTVHAGLFDEIFDSAGNIHNEIKPIINLFNNLDRTYLRAQQRIANAAFKRGGITFTVYSDKQATEKIFPFDLIPRIIQESNWRIVEKGLLQRVNALNAFLNDIYGRQRILTKFKALKELVSSSSLYCEKVRFIKPPGNIYIHIAGIDIIRDHEGNFLVLEDNIRTPSGVSYVLENRFVMKRLFPEIFSTTHIRPVEEYPYILRRELNSIMPSRSGLTVVLTPGANNSAYFEHSFLARNMGCELVRGSDLFVQDNIVYLKTTQGPKPVQVIYRRIDDDFLDPEVFNKDSLLGVPGLMRAYAAGNIILANAIGNGIGDDKAIYPFVPDMIRFYLDEEPLLAQVRTYSCADDKERNHVLKNLSKMVIKQVDASGGYGMLIGPHASQKQLEIFKEKIKATPRNYIAQPVIELSTCPTYVGNKIAARRVDLRPYVISGQSQWVLPGGLTRVALMEGSYVVNSSQGGGSKDTWVMEE